MTNILLADDHELVREGVKWVLESEPHLKVRLEARDWDEVLQKVEDESIDLLVTDISMPGTSFADAMVQVVAKRPGLPILLVSTHSEDVWRRRAFELGASGYLHKSESADQLVEAVHTVMLGERYPHSD